MDQRKLITGLTALLLCMQTVAQQRSARELKPLFDRLKAIKSYSFENHTDATFPNGQKDAVTTKVFMDKTKQCLLYTNKGETLFLNRKWVYKANHIAKTVQVFDLPAYNKKNKKVSPAIQTLFQNDLVSGFADSVVMKYGKLLSSKKEGNLTTYQIGFPANAALKQVTIIFNETSGLPESIYMKTAIGAGNNKMQSEILCNNYKAVVPEAIFDEHAFFSILNGKLTLTQYKTYKVYTLL